MPDPGCCAPPPDPRIARRFDDKSRPLAGAEEFPPLIEVSARLLDLLRDAPLERPSVLELGCGTGGVSVALLGMGARLVHGVDLSPGSVEVARRRAALAGFAEQSRFEVGDAAAVALEPHDWVVLDRVICCFGDAERLLTGAIVAAGRRIALSLPESGGWRGLINRPLWAAENVWDLLRGGCRGYVHDIRRLERQLAEGGFRRVASVHAGLWYIAAYDRA